MKACLHAAYNLVRQSVGINMNHIKDCFIAPNVSVRCHALGIVLIAAVYSVKPASGL